MSIEYLFDKFIYNFFWLFPILIVSARAVESASMLLFPFLVYEMI